MVYDIKKRAMTLHKTQVDLAELYASCSGIEEFLVKVDVEMPDARARDIRACRLHWLSKAHPFLYCSFWTVLLAVTAISLIVFSAMSCIAAAFIAFVSFFLWCGALFLHMFLHVDMMQLVELVENVKPTKY